MAHWAKVEDGIVTRVIVAEEDFFDDFIDDTPGEWIQTSYSVRGGKVIDLDTNEELADQEAALADNLPRQRKNFAGIGYTYDRTRDAFIPPKQFASWVLNEDSCIYEAPIPQPADSVVNGGEVKYRWDEDAYLADNTAGWVAKNLESDS